VVGIGVGVLWLELELKFEWVGVGVGGWRETGMEDCVCSDNFFYEELWRDSCGLIGVGFVLSYSLLVLVCYRAIYDLGFLVLRSLLRYL
jgi:hypothetical protein